jgi:hypothetical protein
MAFGALLVPLATPALATDYGTVNAGGVIDNSCAEQIDPGGAGDNKFIWDQVSFPHGTAYLFVGTDSNPNDAYYGSVITWVYLQGSADTFGLDWSDGIPNAGADWHYCWDGPNGGWPATYAILGPPVRRCVRVAALDAAVWYHTAWQGLGNCS